MYVLFFCIVSLLSGHAYLQRFFFINKARGRRRRRGQGLKQAREPLLLLHLQQTQTHAQAHAHTQCSIRCMHLESILCFLCCCSRRSAPCSRCCCFHCWRSSNAYEYLVCSARKIRFFINFTYVCHIYICTRTHSHRNTHTLLNHSCNVAWCVRRRCCAPTINIEVIYFFRVIVLFASCHICVALDKCWTCFKFN